MLMALRDLWEDQALGTLMPFSHGLGDFMKEPKVYEDLVDLTVLKTAMETALNEYNLSPSVVPMQLVLFREAIEHSECWLLRALLTSHPQLPCKGHSQVKL